MPTVYIVAGPNGAGKTTFARDFLPKYANCDEFLNADMIAQGLSPFDPQKAAFRAGRIMLEEIESHCAGGHDFAFETTLSGRSYLNVFAGLRSHGYSIQLFMVYLENVELALARVRDRVLQGGHDIPEDVMRRRFDRSMTNFFLLYRPLADLWMLFNNSSAPPEAIAFERRGMISIIKPEIYERLLAQYAPRLK